MRATLSVLTLAALMALPIAAAAQVNTATINGIVSDESKAILPGATVTASDLATGRKYVGVSDERGAYKISVPPGTYQVQAELSGFGNAEVPKVELLVGQNASIAFTLKISSLAETLTVTGEAPLVDLTSTQVAGNVDRRQMEAMPLQGRNWLELSMLVKGITANNVTNSPGVSQNESFNLNLDGQQIKQNVLSVRQRRAAISAARRSPNSRSSRTCSTSPRADRPASRCRRSRSRARTACPARPMATSATTSSTRRTRWR